MAGPSISELLAVAGQQPTSNALLQRSGLLRYFFQTWLKLDLTTLAAAVTIFGTITGLANSSKTIALKFYWWFTQFCTASVSIAANDRLNKEILNWIGDQVLTRQGTRILTARTEAIQTDASLYFRHHSGPTERNDVSFDKRIPIQYLPTFGTTWFVFERNIFLVRRMAGQIRTTGEVPTEYAVAPEGNEPLVIMCLGRSVAPIKQFLESCRDFAEQQRAKYVTVRVMKSSYGMDTWATTILRPMRPLETVHFDEAEKAALLADMRSYLDPATRLFYNQRGIPYRRGYLLHGTPGTGKTSLSIALAGYFSLELYLLHVPSVKTDGELEQLFTALPPRCIVLLEDIDAVGMSRRPDSTEASDEEDEEFDQDEWKDLMRRRAVTLSGLLNVLDGVASQEGRIVLMTSNHANRLDKALVRPGRIDKMILMGHISQRSAELMFLRMYAPDMTHNALVKLDLEEGELQKLALDFSVQIPENTITPAQLQGYLLNRRESPRSAIAETAKWVEEEQAKAVEREKQNREAAKRWREEKTKKQAAGLPQFPPGMEGLLDPGMMADISQHMDKPAPRTAVQTVEKAAPAVNGEGEGENAATSTAGEQLGSLVNGQSDAVAEKVLGDDVVGNGTLDVTAEEATMMMQVG